MTTGTDIASPPYKVEDVEIVAANETMQARIFRLAPGKEIPWHFHSAVTDWYVCLEGTLSVETRAPRADHRLAPGGLAVVPAKTAHHVVNSSSEPCRFLLLQGVGPYDFKPVGR
jgi:quercetin dioxygenase-like cupin family protein